jgi:glycosyltransferase involved in cell wall biosynthesis
MKQIKIAMLGASLEQNGGIATVEKLIIKHVSSDIKIEHITSHDEGSIIHRIKVFTKSFSLLAWRLLTQKTDIVHLHISDGGSILRKALLALMAFTFRKPVLIHTHGAEFHITYAKLPKWIQQIFSFLFSHCGAFIVLSKAWKDYYVENLGLDEQQVVILPNPTELPYEVPVRSNREKVKIGFFGRVGERKGTFDLIKAFANLPPALKNSAEIIIAGDGDLDKARMLVSHLGLTNHINFLGWIDSQKRDELLASVDIFALPSYNEGFPMALLEAMGWALPAIVTPIGGIPELITQKKNGLLVNPGDIQELSDAIQCLIEDEDLRISLGNAARQTVAPFDIKTYCEHLDDIYSSIIEIKPRSKLYPGVAG